MNCQHFTKKKIVHCLFGRCEYIEPVLTSKLDKNVENLIERKKTTTTICKSAYSMVVEVIVLFFINTDQLDIAISLFCSLNFNIISFLLLLGECFQQFFISFKLISLLFFPLKKLYIYYSLMEMIHNVLCTIILSVTSFFPSLTLYLFLALFSYVYYTIVTTSTFTHRRFDFFCV